MTAPCDLSAVEARRLIGTKNISPVALMQSCLDRIERVNGSLNAIVTCDPEMGRAAARAAEAAVMRGEDLGALHGLPVAIKDLDETAGLRTTHGSLLFKNHVPGADDPMIARVRAAGGLIFAKTNTPEFGAGANTTNRVFGATSNPFDPAKTCGGSSGGSAVALATGMAPLATGSDMGGSLRTPASFCGVVGFRPSPGVVPDPTSSVALSPFAVLGTMGRSVADAHLLLRAQAAHDPRDVFSSVTPAIPEDLVPADLSKVRAALSTDLGVAPVDQTIAQLFKDKATTFRHHFRTAEDRDPDLGGVHDAFEILRAVGFVAAFRERLATKRDLLGPNIIDNTERGLKMSLPDVAAAHLTQSTLYRRFIDFFDDVDVLIAPATSVSPFPKTERTVTAINGELMPTYMTWLAITYGLTMVLPAVCCIPCGLDHNGLPFGIQVAGPKGTDARVLSVALALEQALASDAATARPLPDLSTLRR